MRTITLTLTGMLAAAGLAARAGSGAPIDRDHRPRALEIARSAPTLAVAPVRRLEGAAPPPVINSISPDTLTPGGQAIITGTGFRLNRQYNTVLVGNVPVKVTSATATQLVVDLPERGLGCQTDGPVDVSVSVNGGSDRISHPLHVAEFVQLKPGEVATPGEMGNPDCVELAQTGGQYWVGVVNTDKDRDLGYMLRGAEGRQQIEGSATPAAIDTGPVPTRPRPAAPDPTALLSLPGSEGPRHLDLLGAERDRVSQHKAMRRNAPARLLGRPAAPAPLPRVGDVRFMRVWNSWGDCTTFDSLSFRVVYVGEHAIIFEDENAPLAGSMDPELEQLGQEFDSVMWPILRANFGDPLLLDPGLDADGRVRMLFTPRVQQLDAGTFGYVTACDFYTREKWNASSNVGEVFYARVPEKQEHLAAWLREARGATIHEVKHITANAERIARGGDLEYAWLEEGTAMIAEELYARGFTGVRQGTNVKFDPGLACEYGPEATCGRYPYALSLSFGELYNYLAVPEGASPIERGPQAYGAGWSLARWAADLSGRPEAEFFSDLTQDVLHYGAENLASNANRQFADLIVDWYVASLMDDADGYVPPRPELDIRSWNTRDVFLGLNVADSARYPSPFPIAPRSRRFGAFVTRPELLPNAAASFTEVVGSQAATQLLSLRREDGSPLKDDAVRMFIVRLR